MGAGIHTWLCKPIDRLTLIEAVRHALPPAVNK